MSKKLALCGVASATLLLSVTASAAETGTQAKIDAPPCLIAGWENPASVCVAHTKTIAATCFICHGPNGKSNGAVPSLAGQDKAYLVTAMQEFKTGKREASVMKKYALGYSDSEYEDLAAYFAAIK